MIIGEKFVWLHFPKCAGTFTERLLRKYYSSDPGISFDPIDPENVIWHHSIRGRKNYSGIDYSDRDIICNIRRLPFWIISRINFEKKRSGIDTPRSLYTSGKFINHKNSEKSADKLLSFFMIPPVKHWIRVENLESDFLNTFSNYLDVCSRVNNEDFSVKVNVSVPDPEIEKWFNNDELEDVYRYCPVWTQLERSLYGNLLTDFVK